MNQRSRACAWGCILAIAGIPCVAVVKILQQKNIPLLSMAIVAVSILLMINYRIFLTGKINKMSPGVRLITMYSLVTTGMALFSDLPVMTSGRGALYQFVYLLQIVLLWMCFTRIDQEQFSRDMFWLMGICCVPCALILLEHGIRSGSFVINYLYDDAGEEIVSREATATVGYLTALSCLLFRPERIRHRVCRLLFGTAAMIAVLCSNRRSVYLALCLNAGQYLYTANRSWLSGKSRISRKKFLKVLWTCVLAMLVAVVVYRTVEPVRELLEHAVTSLVQAIQTYLGMNELDQSAAYRHERLAIYPRIFWEESTFSQMLFGRGYMNAWLDLPYFQALWDLGLVGGLVYYVCQYLIPIPYLLRKDRRPVFMLGQFLTVHGIICSFVNGFPYGVFFPIVLMVAFSPQNLRKFERRGKAC